jgi:hypothetical protein
LKRFSEREGLKKVRTEIQVDSIDKTLRNRLWNVLDYYYWSEGKLGIFEEMTDNMRAFVHRLWHSFYKEPVDDLSWAWSDNHEILKERFFNAQWHEIYDFIEFTANNYPDEEKNKKFMKTCNEVLEAELSAYRFVGNQIVKTTSEKEISEIEEALESPFKTVNMHLEKALELWSDRKSPDFRNSIKESTSAVEGICRIIADDDKATLGKALDAIENQSKIDLHGALKKAFDSLYGYTSSAEGIRHAFSDEKVSVGFEDAKFMLVSCSAFVNYLISKASKAGINVG